MAQKSGRLFQRLREITAPVPIPPRIPSRITHVGITTALLRFFLLVLIGLLAGALSCVEGSTHQSIVQNELGRAQCGHLWCSKEECQSPERAFQLTLGPRCILSCELLGCKPPHVYPVLRSFSESLASWKIPPFVTAFHEWRRQKLISPGAGVPLPSQHQWK